MTDVASLGDLRPKVHGRVRLGPAQRRGASIVHFIKNADTEWFYRIGAREHFLLSRMDGTRSIDEINADHAEHYGRELTESEWQTLLQMLGARQLLDGWQDPEQVERLREEARAKARANPRPWQRYRFPIVNPERLLVPAARLVGPLIRPAFVVPGLIAVVALCVFLAGNFGDLWADWRDGPSRAAVLPGVIAVAWASIGLHEFAHGLVCTHYGGTVREIGVLWRLPMFAWYCKVDDVMLFEKRGQRVATAFAGVFVTLLTLIPFAPAWANAEPGTPVRTFFAGVLVVGVIAALVNLVPFFQLDGYYMLTHALGLADLRLESYRYWRLRLRAWRGGDADELAGYRRLDRVAYALYGAMTALVLAGLLGGMFTVWFLTLRPLIGAGWSALLLGVEALVVLALISWYVQRRRRRALEEAEVEASA